MQKPSFQVRAEVFKGRECFKVCGRNQGGWKQSIHGLTRAAADHIKGKLLRGEDIELVDYTYQPRPQLTVLKGGR